MDGIRFSLNSGITIIEGEGILEGAKLLETQGDRIKSSLEGKLYADKPAEAEKCRIRAIPYYTWQNRGETDMDVWLPYRE